MTYTDKFSYYLRTLRIRLDWITAKMAERLLVSGFHKLLYYAFSLNNIFGNKKRIMTWLGVVTGKSPLDCWIYQEIIWETRPEVIIETGTNRGGSALFFASLFDLIGKGEVITVDIKDYNPALFHARITKTIGDSASLEVFKKIKNMIGQKSVMVVLDSDHRKDHVLKELGLYSNLVAVGQYLVVEDTNINGHPVLPGWGPGPKEAIEEFLTKNKNFEVDFSREKFFVSFHPSGFLRKIQK